MNDSSSANSSARRALPVTPRDLLMIGFRHQVAIALTFGAIALGVFLYVLLRAPAYRAHMTILVKRERVDPVVTTEEVPKQQLDQGVTEQELNSEVELLRSDDLIEKVIVSTGLVERRSQSFLNRLRERLTPAGTVPVSARRLAVAVSDFQDDLTVEPVKKTTLIRVTYKEKDPVLAARALTTLANAYLEKHLAVHRSAGAFDFFEQEAERYRQALASVRDRAANYAAAEGVVSVALEKEITVRQIGEFEAALQKTRAQIAEVGERMRSLEQQVATTPERVTTEIRDAQARLMETQQSTLLSLELKRIELLQAFQPTYPPVVEVETQIAKTKSSIEAAKKSPIVEAVTNRDPTHDYLILELAKARTELAALEASATRTTQVLTDYRQKAQHLDRVQIVQEDIDRDVKLAEQNYMAYVKKREDTRISNALDVRRIVNVAVAEAPTVPALPDGLRRLIILALGLVLAAFASVALALTFDYLDPSFRTPEEVESFLGCPVLAALPKSS